MLTAAEGFFTEFVLWFEYVNVALFAILLVIFHVFSLLSETANYSEFFP